MFIECLPGANHCTKCSVSIIAFTYLRSEGFDYTHFTYECEVKLFVRFNYLYHIILLEIGQAGVPALDLAFEDLCSNLVSTV